MFIVLLLLLLHPFNGLFSRTTWVSRYQKGKTSLDLNEASGDGVLGWQWHLLADMQTICTSLQTDNRINTSSLNFYRPAAVPDAQPTVSKHWRHTYVHCSSVKYILATTLAGKVMQSVVSIRLCVCLHSSFWTNWPFSLFVGDAAFWQITVGTCYTVVGLATDDGASAATPYTRFDNET